MAKYLITLIFFVFSCSNNDQVVSKKNLSSVNISFDVVSKSIEFYQIELDSYNQIAYDLINEWYNNKIKTNGLEGSLKIIVTKLDTISEKKDDHFKITTNIAMTFHVDKINLNSKKTFDIEVVKFSEISGEFSILDQENLSSNTVNEAIIDINKELIELI